MRLRMNTGLLLVALSLLVNSDVTYGQQDDASAWKVIEAAAVHPSVVTPSVVTLAQHASDPALPLVDLPQPPGMPPNVARDTWSLTQRNPIPNLAPNLRPSPGVSGARNGYLFYGMDVFGEPIYLRARSAEVAYALPVDGPIVPPASGIQNGPTAIADPEYDLGFRGGLKLLFSETSSLGITLSTYQSETNSSRSVLPPDLFQPLVTHPSLTSSATNVLDVAAQYAIDFNTVDVDFRGALYCGQMTSVDYLIGARYGELEQDFMSSFSATGTSRVDTNIRFDGAGLRTGAEFYRYTSGSAIFLYGRTAASILAGEFRARYRQRDQSGITTVTSSWRSGRVVPIVDMELGAGWASAGGRLQLSAGYLFSTWFNAVLTEEYISAAQTGRFNSLGDALTFDGLTASAVWRF